MEILTMDESEIDALLSQSTENNEVPSKRRKLEPINSSPHNPPDNNSKRLSAFDRIFLARQLTTLRKKLSETKVNAARILLMREEMDEFFEQEGKRLDKQAEAEEDDIETLEVSLESGVKSSLDSVKSQTATESEIVSIEKRVKEKIDALFREDMRNSERLPRSRPEKKTQGTQTPPRPQEILTPFKYQRTPINLKPQVTPTTLRNQATPITLKLQATRKPSKNLLRTQETSTPSKHQTPKTLKLQQIPTAIKTQQILIPVKAQQIPAPSRPQEIKTPLKPQQTPTPLKLQQIPTPLKTQQILIPIKAQQIATPLKTQQILIPLKTQQIPTPLKPQESKTPLKPPETPPTLSKPQKTKLEPQTQPEKKIERMLEQIFSENTKTKKLNLQNTIIREVKIENRKYVPVRAKITLKDGKTGVIKLEEVAQSAEDIISILRDPAEEKLPLGEKIFNMQVDSDDAEKVGNCKPEESKTSLGALEHELPCLQQSEIIEMQERNQERVGVDELQEENGTPQQECEDSERMGDDSIDENDFSKSDSELVVDEFPSDQIDNDDSTCDGQDDDESPSDHQPEDLNKSPEDHQPEDKADSPDDNPPEDKASSSPDYRQEAEADSPIDDPLEDRDDSPTDDRSEDNADSPADDSPQDKVDSPPDQPPEDEDENPSKQEPPQLGCKIIVTDAQAIGQQRHELRVPASGHYVLASDSRFFKIAWEKHYKRNGPKDMVCIRCSYVTDSRQRMQDHIWVKHYEGHFKCPLCPPSRFMLWRHSMKKHIQRVHLIVVNAPSPGK